MAGAEGSEGVGVVKLMDDQKLREGRVRLEANAILNGWASKRLDGTPNIKAIQYDRTIGSDRDVQADYLTVEAAIDRLNIRESVRYLIHVVARNRSESTFDNQNAIARGRNDLKELKLELMFVAESEVL